jgi:hypothetical protein
MRDPERIPKIMSLITLIWDKQPDTRFNQLIHNLHSDYHAKTGRGSFCMNQQSLANAYDLFNEEDEPFQKFLEEKLKEMES